MEVIQKRQKILDVLTEIEQELQTNPETIPEHVFQTMEGICKLIYSAHHSPEKVGWSKKLGYFTPTEGKIIEGRYGELNQIGGGEEEDRQFAEEYDRFQKLMGGIGTQWREITNSLGILTTSVIARRKDFDEIFMFFSAIVEALRIWVAYSYIDSATYRVLLSFSQTILDALRGNVRQAIFSSIGLFGRNGYYISILTRFVLNIIETISPDLRGQLEFDIYKNLKTLSAAGLLWAFYTFAPLNLKSNVNILFREIQEIAKKEEISLGPLISQIRKSAKAEGIDLPDLPLEQVPTYDDLQALGSLLQQPDIACLPSFEKLIAPIRSIFTLRVTLDLFGIPTGQVELDDLCSTQRSTTRKVNQKQKKRKTRRVNEF
jgi:hypothetical protein